MGGDMGFSWELLGAPPLAPPPCHSPFLSRAPQLGLEHPLPPAPVRGHICRNEARCIARALAPWRGLCSLAVMMSLVRMTSRSWVRARLSPQKPRHHALVP